MRSEKDFCIPDEVRLKFPDLVKLIVETESMDDNEKQYWFDILKQYWFDILPSMTEKQVDDFFMVLETERVKPVELERKYGEEIKVLNDKHRIEWKKYEDEQEEIEKEKALAKKLVPREIKDLEKHVEEGKAIISEIEKSRK